MAPIGPKWLSWCSACKSYAYLLDYNGRNRIGSVVIIPQLFWSQQLAKFAAAREERGLVTWIIVSERSGQRYPIDIEDVSLFGLSSLIIVSSEDYGFKWLHYLCSSKVDVISSAFGFTERRYGQVYATVNRFGGASYYVPKRMRVSDDLLLSILPLASLLLLSLVASQLRSMRSSSGIMLAAWMAACFWLAAYTQSLLTASVTAGARWEADDTLDKIFPKLERGELLPCAVPGIPGDRDPLQLDFP
ncbi:hypothetical protein HPB52_008149 [Rhipicephalus sanguineus]|uniref:Ionotropic receptor n=1 Tax=Rhipicephalus sanguineus TaxID=34632 RepID=A0A9D4PHU5_RHISA|nr:hypothetical protein HPB52_008149 [Rhipicephalus sanguineus]